MRLNGWQRLLVVLAVLWTLVVGFVVWQQLQQLSDLSVERWALSALAVLGYWLFPPLALYAAGLTIRWVYRGFRPPPATPH